MENFEELNYENNPQPQSNKSGGDPEKLKAILVDARSKGATIAQLDEIVKRYRQKNTPSQPKGVQAGTNQNGASKSVSANGVSLLDSGDVKPKGYEGLTKKPKTFIEQVQEAERTRPKIGQEQKTDITEKSIKNKIPKIKADALGKKLEDKAKENYYSNTDADSRWNDIKQPSSKEAINVFNNYPNLNTSGVNIIDFAQFLKNNTRYFEDKNIDNNNKTESEFVKNKYLQDYLADRRNFLENKLKYTKPEDKNNYNKVVSELNSINDKYENYVNTYLPEFAKLRNETILKQKENYSRIKKGDLSQYYNDAKNLVERFVKGGTNPILDMINTGLDKVGAENLADKLRVDRNITEYKSNMNNITNAKGSVVNYNNNEYIVTSSGEIIDSDTKTVINSFTDKNTINKIYDLTKKSDKVKTLYSGRGYANSFSDLAGNLTTQILLTKGTASAAAKVGLGANLSTKVGEITSVFGMVGASTYEQTLQELRDAGINDETAKTEANKIAALTATASAVSSYFMPNANANKVTQGLNTKLLIKESIDVLKKEGKEGLANFLKTKASKIIYNSPDIIKEGGGEFLQEILEGKAQYIANQNANTEIGKQVLQEGFKEGELLDTFILSATAGSLGASLGKTSEGAFGMDIKENFEYLSNIDTTKIDKIGNNLVNSGDITQEEFTNLKNQILNYRNNKSKLPSNIKGKKAIDATQLIAERENLKQQKKNLDEVFHPEIDIKIENINNQLKNVLNQSENTNGKNDKNTSSTETKSEEDSERPKSETGDRETENEKEINYNTSDFKEYDPEIFVENRDEVINKRNELGKPDRTSPLSIDEAKKIKEEGGKFFMTDDGTAGGYVKADGYIGGLFKHPESEKNGASEALKQKREEAGGKFFDTYDTEGSRKDAEKNGFVPVARVPFDENFAKEGWEKDPDLKNKPDVVFYAKSDIKPEVKNVENYNEAYEIAKNYESKQTIDKTEKTGGNEEGKDTSNDEISKGKSGEETGGNVTVSFDDSDSKSSGGSKVYNFASSDVTPLRESFSELKKAYKDGVRDTQSLKREFINKVKQSIKGLGNYITERDAKSILNQVGNVTEKNIEEVSKIIDNISDRLEERKMKSEFAQVKGKLKKNSKSGSKLQPTNIKETAKQALTINEKYLSPEQQIEFKNIIDEINDSFSSVTSDKYKMMDVEKVMEKIDKLKEISDNNQLKELADMLGVDSSIVPKDELLKLWKSENADEFAKNLSEAKKKEVRDKLQKQTEYSKIGLKDVDFGSLDNIQKKFLRNLLKSDLSKLDLEGLKQFIKFSDNIIVNGDFSNVGKLSAKIESIKNIESLMNIIRRDNIKVEKVSTDKKGITGIAKSIFDTMTDISLTLNQIMGSAKNGSMAYNYLNFFDLSNANTRANKRGEKFLDNYNNLIKSLKKNTFDDITHGESVIKRSIFSTLLQADYSSPESMKRFKDGYIQHSIDMLKKYTNDSQSSNIAEICERTLKDLKDINTKEELIDYLKNNESKNYKIIRFVSGKEGFLGLTKEFSDNSYYNHGVIFEPKKEEDYYVPLTSSNVIKPKLLKGNIEDAKKSGDLEGIVAPNSKSGSIFSRNNNVRLKEGETINFDFDSFISQKYKEQLYDIEATNEILKTKNILTNPEFLDKFGSSANLLNQKAFNKIVLDSGRNIYKHSDIERSILKAERFAGKLASVQALGGFLQYPKQYVSVAIGASIRLAENAPLLFKYMMMDKAGTELLKMSSIAMRGESEGGTKRLSDNIKKDVLTTNKYNNIIKDISSMTGMKIEKAREFFMLSLRKGDVNIANTTFLAYYHDFLLRKGVKNSEIDINKEHEKIKEGDELRKEALAYAQHMVNTTQLSSDLSEGSDLLTNQSVAFKLLSRVVIPFSSFSNHSMVRLAKASGGVLTGENKVENFKEATASVSEIIAFQSIKALVIAPMLMAASKAIFQDDDETQKKTTDWAFQMNKVISGSLQDFSPLPDSFDTDFINYIMYLKNKDNYKVDSFEDFAGKVKKDKSEEKPWTMYKYGDEDGWDFLKGGVKDAGLYQVFIDQNKKTLESFDALMDNEITQKNKYGQTEQYHFDEKYRNFLIMNAISNTMSSVGVFDADVKRFIESEYRDVKKDSKVHSSGGSSSSSGFGGFGSGFSKGFRGFGK